MKASELRIGNLIYNFLDEVIDVNNTTIGSFSVGESVLGSFNPIPLTEEWLIKLGFEYEKDLLIKYLSKDEKYYYIGLKFNKFPLIFEIDGNAIPLHKIKHVHQLQNLYFSLTGEELTLK